MEISWGFNTKEPAKVVAKIAGSVLNWNEAKVGDNILPIAERSRSVKGKDTYYLTTGNGQYNEGTRFTGAKARVNHPHYRPYKIGQHFKGRILNNEVIIDRIMKI